MENFRPNPAGEHTSPSDALSEKSPSKESLHLDYEQTTDQIRMLTDIRFKLLAFVPTLTGVAVTLLTGDKVGPWTVLAVGILGFVVTFGIIIYELRNSLFYDLSIQRAIYLEAQLHFLRPSKRNGHSPETGGIFTDRPDSASPGSQKFLGVIRIKHDIGLAIAYGASLGGWTFIAINVNPLDEPWRFLVSLLAGILIAGITIWEFWRLDEERNNGKKPKSIFRLLSIITFLRTKLDGILSKMVLKRKN